MSSTTMMSPEGYPAWTRLSMISCCSSTVLAGSSALQPNANAPQVTASTIDLVNISFLLLVLNRLVKRPRHEAGGVADTPQRRWPGIAAIIRNPTEEQRCSPSPSSGEAHFNINARKNSSLETN